ncbi:MAG TPA: hypothetical protein PK447_04780, partial [Ignavibacteria bacterium]|nr:hypothetical protein [Ignavibacteria bacterium]
MSKLYLSLKCILIIPVLLIYTSAAGETKDNENLFFQETIFTGYRYFPYITIKDLNLSLDKYHQIDKSKMNKSQQDTIQTGIITPGDLLFDIAVLYKT